MVTSISSAIRTKIIAHYQSGRPPLHRSTERSRRSPLLRKEGHRRLFTSPLSPPCKGGERGVVNLVVAMLLFCPLCSVQSNICRRSSRARGFRGMFDTNGFFEKPNQGQLYAWCFLKLFTTLAISSSFFLALCFGFGLRSLTFSIDLKT